jgi:ribosome biogenesis GTPase
MFASNLTKRNQETAMTSLYQLGWNAYFDQHFKPFQQQGFNAGRIAVENRDNYVVLTDNQEYRAEVTGKLLFNANSSSELPKVGDWVVVSIFETEKKSIIHEVLPRQTKFSRKIAGKKTEQQILATNIDYIFIVQSCDDDFSLRRLERQQVMVYEGGTKSIVVLNKIDLCDNYEEYVSQISRIVHDDEIVAVSAKTDLGMDRLKSCLKQGKTYAFIGSSGVGKTSLINKIIGEEIYKTNEVRDKDSKGRHTTSRRELIVIPAGGLLIDTPGLREFQLWEAEDGLDEVYSEITNLAEGCRFADCTHRQEIGCAVLDAVANGILSKDRYESYLKLSKEMAYLKKRQEQHNRYNSKQRFKEISRAIKNFRKLDHKSKFR